MLTRNISKKKPLVSVIVACFNGEKYINCCLESLLSQTYSNIEIIVCDDCSTDRSYQTLEKFCQKDKRIKILKNDPNLYAAKTRNKCIHYSQGDYLLIQDIDDKSDPLRVEVLLQHITEERIDFISSGMICFNEDGLQKRTIKKVEYPQKKDFLWGLPFFHAPTMFNRECIQSVHGYREAKETRRGQDYDLFMRLYAAGYRGKNISEALYWCRVDKAAIKRRSFSARVDECKIRYYGFLKLGLIPVGLPFVFKPLLAHFVQMIRYRQL